jgi:carbonic anhydrase
MLAEGAMDERGSDAADEGSPTVVGRRRMLAGVAYAAAGAAVGVTLGACASSNGGSGASAQTGSTVAPGTAAPGTTVPVTTPRPDTPAEAYESLKAGNERFATGAPLHPNQGVELRESVADTQNPFIGVLACADSRVVPELIFDQGISDVFDVRVAGNIAAPADLSSLVYAVEVLGVDVITVMGHSNCGAVKAAIDVSTGKMQPGEFAPLTDAIQPAVAAAKPTSNTGDQLQKTIEENARLQAAALTKNSPALAAAVKEGRLTIVPSVYDLASGRVRILS